MGRLWGLFFDDEIAKWEAFKKLCKIGRASCRERV